MIVTESPNRVNSRWLQASVLLCAVAVLPLGVVYAQDHQAVGKRLRAAVEAGELTGEQARAMLGTLRKADSVQKDRKPDRAREYLMKVKKELGGLVEAGVINEEDAAERYAGAEKSIKEKMAAGRSERRPERITREGFVRARSELRKLIDEGKVSKEDGRVRLSEMRKAMAERSGDARPDWEGIKKRIEGAVNRGDMTREEADAKYKALREGRRKRIESADKSDGMSREELGKRLRKAIASEQDMRARLEGLRKEMADRRGAARPDWESIKKRIEGAVKSGDITREEADAKYKGILERMSARRDQ